MRRTQCPVCALPYVMQAVDDPARRTHNPNPKWEVPLDVRPSAGLCVVLLF